MFMRNEENSRAAESLPASEREDALGAERGKERSGRWEEEVV